MVLSQTIEKRSDAAVKERPQARKGAGRRRHYRSDKPLPKGMVWRPVCRRPQGPAEPVPLVGGREVASSSTSVSEGGSAPVSGVVPSPASQPNILPDQLAPECATNEGHASETEVSGLPEPVTDVGVVVSESAEPTHVGGRRNFPVRRPVRDFFARVKDSFGRLLVRMVCGAEHIDILDEQDEFDTEVELVLQTSMPGSGKGVSALAHAAVLESAVGDGVDVADWSRHMLAASADGKADAEGVGGTLAQLRNDALALNELKCARGQRVPRFVAACILCIRELVGAPPYLENTFENRQMVMRKYLKLCRDNNVRTYDVNLHMEDVVEGVFREWVVDPRRRVARVPQWARRWLSVTARYERVRAPC